jgi:hypothetical protein
MHFAASQSSSSFYKQRDCGNALCNVAVSITIFQRHDFSDVRRSFQSIAKFAERFANDVTFCESLRNIPKWSARSANNASLVNVPCSLVEVRSTFYQEYDCNDALCSIAKLAVRFNNDATLVMGVR